MQSIINVKSEWRGLFDFREPADLGEDDREELMIMIII